MKWLGLAITKKLVRFAVRIYLNKLLLLSLLKIHIKTIKIHIIFRKI